jgi:phospholipid/cholesterol/gamma-HCH transport system substrate-binding protein
MSDTHDMSPPVRHLALKAWGLVLLTAALMAASAVYLMYARGLFEATQTLVLTTDDSEGVTVGMDMTFQGFPIGRVRRVELGVEGDVRIVVDVARKEAHWLRTSSVFTLVRGLVGGTNLRAHTGILSDPPLADGAVRSVLRGDAAADIPRVMTGARDLLENLTALTGADAPLRKSLAHLEAVTARAQGPGGALGVLLGNEADRRAVSQLLTQTDTVLVRVEQLAARTDTQVFGSQGLVPETRQAVIELTGALTQTRESLRKVDAVLQDAQAVSGQLREASTDLGALRTEIDANVRAVESMIQQLQRRWPFARDPREAEVRLP